MKRTKLMLITILTIAFVACENFSDLDDVAPNDAVATEEAVTDFNSAVAALNGVYDEMQDGTLAFDGWLALPQYFSDEAVFTGTFPTRLEFGNFNVFPANSTMAAVFTDFYDLINVANNVIDILPTVDDPSLTDEITNSFIGEARFARALAYFYLTQGWNDVPLILEPTSSDELGDKLNVAPTPRSEIISQIIADLEFAEQNVTTSDPERATAAAAGALLARVHLIEGNYPQAFDKATQVLGEGFDLTQYAYLEDQIFYLNFTSVDGNALNFYYGPAEFGGRHSIEPSAKLINGYEPGDARFAMSIDTTSATVPFSIKYNDFSGGSNAGTDPIFFIRHAELVLIAAEAAAEAGNFTEASAWYNQVRARAGLPEQTLTAENYVDLILQERFIELSLEGGHRLWDLRRRGMAEQLLGPLGYDACDNIWPYPQRDVDRNPNLPQNNCCNC